jgi:hypothetical protein
MPYEQYLRKLIHALLIYLCEYEKYNKIVSGSRLQMTPQQNKTTQNQKIRAAVPLM